ncbi:MAG: type II secretion system protein [Candidatus Pacebacteria bacterium]|nr:type II secretion system protein [Candidatus Paceibacterota bacterium]
MKKKHNLGFTLIELLVVISVISLLSSIVLVSLNNARIKARDVLRISDLKQLNLALTLYYDDNGEWPCLGLSGNDTFIDDQTHCLASALVPNYISIIPTDPLYGNDGSTTWGGDYQYNASGNIFLLRTMLEGNPLQQNAKYPNGTTCQDGGYSVCPWRGKSCIYVTGGSCDVFWIHLGQ